MNIFMVVINACEEPNVLRIVLFVRQLINFIFIFVPILLIIILVVDLFKNVISSDEGAQRKNMSLFFKRILMCILMFLVPTFVNFIDNFLNETISFYDVTYQSCYRNSDRIEFYESMKALKLEEEERKALADKMSKSFVFRISERISRIITSVIGRGNNGKLTLDVNDVTKVSNASLSDLQKAFNNNKNGANAKNFLPYASKYLELEKKYGVNVFFVLGIHAQESGWLTSNVTKDCNNIGGVKYAKQKGSFRCSATSEFASEGSYYAGWNSIDEFLEYYFAWIKKSYLTEGGEYYHGKSVDAFNTNYNGEAEWASAIKSLSNSFYEAAKG